MNILINVFESMHRWIVIVWYALVDSDSVVCIGA